MAKPKTPYIVSHCVRFTMRWILLDVFIIAPLAQVFSSKLFPRMWEINAVKSAVVENFCVGKN